MAEQIISKRCSKCKEIKPISEFYKNPKTKDKRSYCCKKCAVEYSCKRQKTRKVRIERKQCRDKKRKTLLKLLGGKCVRCGFDDWRALQIDHIDGGGRKHRRKFNNILGYYNDIEKSIISEEGKYQLLCANCNQIKKYEKDLPKQYESHRYIFGPYSLHNPTGQLF
jgi:formate-dependent nitrite reductase cytochrome c552 subunit